MTSQEQVDVAELVRADKATMEVASVTKKSGEKAEAVERKVDTRFVNPSARKPIKEDSGTYSVVFKKA